jgi:hypothetical protein
MLGAPHPAHFGVPTRRAQRECRAQSQLQLLAQFFRNLRRRDGDVGQLVDPATPGLEVGDRSQQESGVLVVLAKAGIAFYAKKSAYLPGRMTMIDPERTIGFLFADRTEAALPCQEPMIVGRRDPVTAEIALPFPVFVVGAQSFSPTLVDLVLVGRQVTAIPRKLSLAIFRIFCISLSVPNGFGGNHRCFPPPIHW